jgi:hypothetical protein
MSGAHCRLKLKKKWTLRREPRGTALGDNDERAPRSGGSLSTKIKNMHSSPRAKGPALGDTDERAPHSGGSLSTKILKKSTLRREPRGRLSAILMSGPHAPEARCLLKLRKCTPYRELRGRLSVILTSGPHAPEARCLLKFKKMHSSPRAKGPSLGEGPLFTESETLTEDYFHQILFKNSKQIRNFYKT